MNNTNTEEIKFIDIEKVFASKNPKLLKYIPGFLIRYLKKITHQDDINQFMNSKKYIYGIDYAIEIVKKFNAKASTIGLENIPTNGRYVFAANHPLGGLDGMIFVQEISARFTELKFPVNDILMSIKNLDNIFLPINKHGSHTKEAVKAIDEAYASDSQILMFPAGLVSRKQKGEIKDLDWKPNFVKKAIQHKRDVVPVYISGQNSKFFYNLARLRSKVGLKANIEMLYLVDEMYKQFNKSVEVTFGEPVPWQSITEMGSPKTAAQKIKDKVYALSKNN